jgi:hypothetical protein
MLPSKYSAQAIFQHHFQWKKCTLYSIKYGEWLVSIEIRLECRWLQKCFLIWNYYVGCLWAPLLVKTKSKETVFLIKFGVSCNKNKILTILFIIKKSTLTDEFLVLSGPIISRFFACSNEEKNIPKQQRVCALVLSLCL